MHLPPSKYRDPPTKSVPNQMNYNAEIPFEKRPMPGFFDTSSEKATTKELEYLNNTQLALESRNKMEEEKQLRKKDKEKQKKKEQTNLPEAILQVSKLNDPEFLHRRTQLVLPAPQVSDAELEEIGKMGLQANALLGLTQGGSSKATNALLSDYSSATPMVGSSTALRTARTPATADAVLLEAQNLIALTAQQTPLMGGDNVSLNKQFDNFKSSSTGKTVSATPNPLATPGIRSQPGATPMMGKMGATPTPMRDSLRINDMTPAPSEQTIRAERQRQEYVKSQLRDSLKTLPAPANDRFVALKTSVDDEDEDDVTQTGDIYEDDAGEMKKRREARRVTKENIRFRKQSQPVQRNLPRPIIVNEDSDSYAMDLSTDDDELLDRSRDMIAREMFVLVRYDNAVNPYKEEKRQRSDVHLEDIKLSQMQRARAELEQEISRTSQIVPLDLYTKIWTECVQSLTNGKDAMVTEESIESERQRVQNLESRLDKLTKGYTLRSQAFRREIDSLDEEIKKATRDLEGYRALHDLESHALPKRISHLEDSLKEQKEREQVLQEQYRKLLSEKEQVLNALRVV
jgi:pre-mRNA-splicing factor CDC5/CEF1